MLVSKLLNDRAIQTQKPISVRYFFPICEGFSLDSSQKKYSLLHFGQISMDKKIIERPGARAFCILYLLGVDRLYLSPAGQVLQKYTCY